MSRISREELSRIRSAAAKKSIGSKQTQFKPLHGLSILPDGSRDSTYSVWRTMRQRCNDPSHKSYASYGGAGVSVCFRWNNFALFLEDMGKRPSKAHSIDRLDNSKGYEPDNCRWATPKEQARNKKSVQLLKAFGETKLLVEHAEQWKIRCDTLRYRLKSGMTPEVALATPVKKVKK